MIFFLNFALPCFDFVCFLETVLLPDLCGFFFDETDLCGYEIFNRFLFSDSHEDIDYSSFPTFSLCVLLHTTQFLFRDFCF